MNIKNFLFNRKKYNSLPWRISYFLYNGIPFISHGWNKYKNPWYYWWKTRKYFKRPKAHFICGEYNGCWGLPCSLKAYRGLQFFISGLGWKDKYRSPRHEWDPVIAFVFTSPFKSTMKSERFGETKYHKQWWIAWVFNWVIKGDRDSQTASLATWEAILNNYAYNKDIKWCYLNHQWGDNITIENNLTNKALEEIC